MYVAIYKRDLRALCCVLKSYLKFIELRKDMLLPPREGMLLLLLLHKFYYLLYFLHVFKNVSSLSGKGGDVIC